MCKFHEPVKVKTAIEISFMKVAPSPPWSRKAHYRLCIGLLPLNSVLIDSFKRSFVRNTAKHRVVQNIMDCGRSNFPSFGRVRSNLTGLLQIRQKLYPLIGSVET